MTSRTLFQDSPSKALDYTREMHIVYQKMMQEFGIKLLFTFIGDGGDKDKRFAVLNGIRDFFSAMEEECPKDILTV